ncbi:MAG: hypothetical protein JSS72_04000 [Armatimonadetes bacterium]|nr:hypothetical protein [Armatimonadota bacterium]
MTSFLAIAALALVSGPKPPALLTGAGDYHKPVATQSALAQKYFDQGLALFYAFHKTNSGTFFEEAARLDPTCAMAYWGIAMSCAPDINFTAVDDESSKKAIAALEKAKALAKPGLEADLINACALRYASPAPADRSALDKAYADRMRELYKKYPNDPDVASLYAEAILILSPWHQWEPDGKPVPGTTEAMDVLRHAMKLSPKHLMANHLWIHTVEAGPHPELATGSADLLCKLTPTLGHLVHMPSHIYVRTGKWNQAIEQNREAIISDRAFVAKRGLPPTYLPYMGHNRMMMAYAGAMNGSYKAAEWAFSDWNTLVPPDIMKQMAPILDWIVGMPLDVEKRFGHWDKVLSAPEPPEFLPITRTSWHADRAVAYAALKRHAEAQAEFDKFMELKKAVPRDAVFGNNTAGPVLDVYEHLTRGELLVQQDKMDESIAELRKAVEAEDQLRYDEPPDWIQPCRHTLGAALLKAHKPVDAILVYKEDLRRINGNGWSTLGLANAYKQLGDQKNAAKWMAQYKAIWSKDGEPATSSCLCLPNK